MIMTMDYILIKLTIASQIFKGRWCSNLLGCCMCVFQNARRTAWSALMKEVIWNVSTAAVTPALILTTSLKLALVRQLFCHNSLATTVSRN